MPEMLFWTKSEEIIGPTQKLARAVTMLMVSPAQLLH